MANSVQSESSHAQQPLGDTTVQPATRPAVTVNPDNPDEPGNLELPVSPRGPLTLGSSAAGRAAIRTESHLPSSLPGAYGFEKTDLDELAVGRTLGHATVRVEPPGGQCAELCWLGPNRASQRTAGGLDQHLGAGKTR